MLSGPPADTLLAAWERTRTEPAALGALSLLAVARPELDPPARAALSVGARNAALLQLRTAVLGPTLDARAECPACAEALELELPSDTFVGGDGGDGTGTFELEHAGWQLHYRLLRADDLAELARRGAGPTAGAGTDGHPELTDQEDHLDAAVARARDWLVQRCLLAVTPPDGPRPAPDDGAAVTDSAQHAVAAGGLPDDVVATLAAELTRRDPHAELLLALSCPACGHGWKAELDVPAFVSEELQGWAHRLVHEVHLLASAYGWSEGDILRLPPARRRTYLELVLDGSAPAGGGG